MKDIFSKRFFIKLGTNFIFLIGVFSGVIQIISFCYPGLNGYGSKGWVVIVVVSIVISIVHSWPKNTFHISFSHPDVKIGIKIGNIFDQSGHLVIGFSDTFDTEIGDIVSTGSLQGQFLSSVYSNNQSKLDSDLNSMLQNEESEEDLAKTRGKNKRYKIGTVVTISGEKRKFFCCAYSRMGADLKAVSDINNLWTSLQKLWDKIRTDGEQKAVAMPIIGTNLARVPGISFRLPINLILLSFIINSRMEPIAKELLLVIREEDKDKVNLLEIQDFLKSLDS